MLIESTGARGEGDGEYSPSPEEAASSRVSESCVSSTRCGALPPAEGVGGPEGAWNSRESILSMGSSSLPFACAAAPRPRAAPSLLLRWIRRSALRSIAAGVEERRWRTPGDGASQRSALTSRLGSRRSSSCLRLAAHILSLDANLRRATCSAW